MGAKLTEKEQKQGMRIEIGEYADTYFSNPQTTGGRGYPILTGLAGQ